MKRRGQIEMMGLVIIVILITLGFLFMAMFALNEDTSKKTFTRKGLASSTVGGLLKTNIVGQGCGGESVPGLGDRILEDCALYVDQQNSLYSCVEKHSCDFFHDFVKEFLNDTLAKENKRYEFHARLITQGGSTKSLIEPIANKGGCPKRSVTNRDSSKPFPIQTDAGLIEVELYLCD